MVISDRLDRQCYQNESTQCTQISPRYYQNCQNLSMYTLHPDACAHHQIAVLSQSLCENQDLWAAFLCLSRTSYMEWTTICPKTQRFNVHCQKCFKNSSFSPSDLNCNKYLCYGIFDCCCNHHLYIVYVSVVHCVFYVSLLCCYTC